jgi:hypothetical protein
VRFDVAWFEALGQTMAGDPLYGRISGHFTARILIEEGARAALVCLDGGRIAEVQAPAPLMAPWDFAIRGDAAAWDDLLAAVPPPRCQSVFALAKAGRMRVEGNWMVVMQNLWALTRLLELMRAHHGAMTRAAA